MQVVLSVLHDLYTFAVVYWFGLRTDSTDSADKTDVDSAVLTEYTNTVKSMAAEVVPVPLIATVPEPVGLLPAAPVVDTTKQVTDGIPNVGYAFTAGTCFYALPTRIFDGVIAKLPYGISFQILNTQGKWHNILWNDQRGWIHVDDVTTSNAALTPQFSAGERYDHANPETNKLRTFIDDAFYAAPLEVPLQDVEFVAFKLVRRGLTIAWPAARPRIAGTWQKILKGVTGVHMGVAPKTGSVMEYATADNTGHVAYVDSVYPDGGISLSEVGYPTEGIYSERTLSRQEWKELRPIFIEVA